LMGSFMQIKIAIDLLIHLIKNNLKKLSLKEEIPSLGNYFKYSLTSPNKYC